MFDYTRFTTAELIALLFKEEDRVERKLIDALVNRNDAAPRLREILKNEDYWYEGRDGDYWIGVHAIAILSAMRDEAALPDLIEMVPHLYFANHDWGIEMLPAALARFGGRAVEPFIEWIRASRGAYRDNPDFSHCRHDFSAALTMIAREHSGERGRIADFICGIFADPEEDDGVFLSYSAAHPIVLDRERGTKVVRAAFDRGLVRESIVGKFGSFIRSLDRPDSEVVRELKTDLFEFYHPQAIRDRQRQKAEAKEEVLYCGPGAGAAPAGYSASPAGTVVREEKIGRNDPCPCGSGKKYKKCCGSVAGD